MKFLLTNHLRTRFLQRILKPKKYGPLSICNCTRSTASCSDCSRLKTELALEARRNRKEIDEVLLFQLQNANEERSYLNNSSFMQIQFDKYGYDRSFSFLVYENAVFLVIVRDGMKVVPTCMHTKHYFVGKAAKARNKFKRGSEK